MRIAIDHTTLYRYSEPTRSVIQLLKVTPRSFVGQTVLDWRVDVDCDARLREARDGYGNVVHMLYVDRPVQRLCINVTGRVLTEDQVGSVRGLDYQLPPEVFVRTTPLTQAGPSILALAEELAAQASGPIDILHRLNAVLHGRMRFDTGATGVGTPAEDALAAGHGVCQDFAHIFLSTARGIGIPARYVSGHLFRRDGAHLQEAAHAWVEAFVNDLGWIAFDPANGICADDAYVRVACGLDYRDAAPVVGARAGGGSEELTVEVKVRETRRQSQAQGQN